MKKFIVFAILFSFALVGCGSSEKNEKTGNEVSSAASNEEQTESEISEEIIEDKTIFEIPKAEFVERLNSKLKENNLEEISDLSDYFNRVYNDDLTD